MQGPAQSPRCESQTSVAHLDVSVGARRALVGVEGLRSIALLGRAWSSASVVLVAPKPAALGPPGSSACARTCSQHPHRHAFTLLSKAHAQPVLATLVPKTAFRSSAAQHRQSEASEGAQTCAASAW